MREISICIITGRCAIIATRKLLSPHNHLRRLQNFQLCRSVLREIYGIIKKKESSRHFKWIILRYIYFSSISHDNNSLGCTLHKPSSENYYRTRSRWCAFDAQFYTRGKDFSSRQCSRLRAFKGENFIKKLLKSLERRNLNNEWWSHNKIFSHH